MSPVQPDSLAGESDYMTFHEAITTMVQRPGYIAVLERDKLLRINKAGYILDATKAGMRYALLNTGHVFAVTWECWTPEQLTMAAEANRV